MPSLDVSEPSLDYEQVALRVTDIMGDDIVPPSLSGTGYSVFGGDQSERYRRRINIALEAIMSGVLGDPQVDIEKDRQILKALNLLDTYIYEHSMADKYRRVLNDVEFMALQEFRDFLESGDKGFLVLPAKFIGSGLIKEIHNILGLNTLVVKSDYIDIEAADENMCTIEESELKDGTVCPSDYDVVICCDYEKSEREFEGLKDAAPNAIKIRFAPVRDIEISTERVEDCKPLDQLALELGLTASAIDLVTEYCLNEYPFNANNVFIREYLYRRNKLHISKELEDHIRTKLEIPDGWMSSAELARLCGVTMDELNDLFDDLELKILHPKKFGSYWAKTSSQFFEYVSPDVVKIVAGELLSECPIDWHSATRIADGLGLDDFSVKEILKTIEFSGKFECDNYFDPESGEIVTCFNKAVFDEVLNKQPAPEGWMNRQELSDELVCSEVYVARLIRSLGFDFARNNSERYFCIYKNEFLPYFSPKLISRLIEIINNNGF